MKLWSAPSTKAPPAAPWPADRGLRRRPEGQVGHHAVLSVMIIPIMTMIIIIMIMMIIIMIMIILIIMMITIITLIINMMILITTIIIGRYGSRAT